MMDGEDLIAGLSGLEVDSAVLTCGIGMLRKMELGYWNGEHYEKHRIEEPVELVSLQGTVAMMDGERIVHLHACVAPRDGSTRGGHLFAGTVHNTAEIALRMPLGIALERQQEPSGLSGLRPKIAT
jgi:predicted DNA-binding protein with PD1-like motif